MGYISKPSQANLLGLSQVTVPVNYSKQTGLALLLSDIIVSDKKVIPFVRHIPTAAFSSGVYSFPTPNGYTSAKYQFPMLEPQTWNVVSDVITAYQTVELYQIGNRAYVNEQGVSVPADHMTATFPIIIYPKNYTLESITIKPLDINQSVILRIYKNAGVAVNWAASNIVNNGLITTAINAATELTFVVTNISGTYTVTEWLTPDFVLTDLSSVKTTAKGSLAAIINELFTMGATGTAGGDLTGSYPSPTIKTGAISNVKLAGGITNDKLVGGITNDKLAGNIAADKLAGNIPASKLAAGVIPTTLPPTGAAGGDLIGSYPNPTIGAGKVTNDKLAGAIPADKLAGNIPASKLAAGVIPTTLPPVGTAGGDLSGSYPNPTIGVGKILSAHLNSSLIESQYMWFFAEVAISIGADGVPYIGGAPIRSLTPDGSILTVELQSSFTMKNQWAIAIKRNGVGPIRFSCQISPVGVISGVGPNVSYKLVTGIEHSMSNFIYSDIFYGFYYDKSNFIANTVMTVQVSGLYKR